MIVRSVQLAVKAVDIFLRLLAADGADSNHTVLRGIVLIDKRSRCGRKNYRRKAFNYNSHCNLSLTANQVSVSLSLRRCRRRLSAVLLLCHRHDPGKLSHQSAPLMILCHLGRWNTVIALGIICVSRGQIRFIPVSVLQLHKFY